MKQDGPTPDLGMTGVVGGPSSDRNADLVVQILRNSSADQIASILSQIDAALLVKAVAIAGLESRKQELLDRDLAKWKVTADASQELEWRKSQLLKGRIVGDDDFIAQMYQKAISDRVERWLQSSAGIDAIRLEKSRRVEALAAKDQIKQTSWIDRKLGGGV